MVASSATLAPRTAPTNALKSVAFAVLHEGNLWVLLIAKVSQVKVNRTHPGGILIVVAKSC